MLSSGIWLIILPARVSSLKIFLFNPLNVCRDGVGVGETHIFFAVSAFTYELPDAKVIKH
jgi:hypothetical protein